MEQNWKFCTIQLVPSMREFECTVKINKRGASEPHYVWDGEWITVKRFEKEYGNSYNVYGYRDAMQPCC